MAVLREKLKLKPHVKPRGRSKNSGKFWALKTRKCQIDAVSKTSEESQAKKPKLPDKLLQSKKKSAMTQGTPSFRSQIRRKQRSHLKELNCINTRPIQIDHNDIESDCLKRYDELGLLQTDKKILVSYTERNAWLNARLIIAGQRLLKLRFPNVGGLQLQDVMNKTLCLLKKKLESSFRFYTATETMGFVFPIWAVSQVLSRFLTAYVQVLFVMM